MKTTNCLTSACRYCRFYNPEGRRGGACQQLGVPVEAGWKACSLALPPFTSAWESLEEIMLLETSYNLDSSSHNHPKSDPVTVPNYSPAKTVYFNQKAISA
jgi:hypothetical protein